MVEKSTVDKKQPELYSKLKRVDPRIMKRASRITPDVEAADRARLDALAEVGPGQAVLSIYVNLDPSQFPTPHQRQSEVISLADQAANRVEEVEDEHDRKELRKDVQKVRSWLLEHSEWDDGARGVAIFVSNRRDLFEILKLAVPVASLVAVEEAPYVEPLTALGPTPAA